MKKTGKLIIILLILIGLTIYPILYREIIKTYTKDYVVKQGYPAQAIKDIDILHSYSALLLGYNEWRISVEFKKEPNISFWFTYKNGKIIYQGVNSKPMLDKESVIKYSDKFKDGTLLD